MKRKAGTVTLTALNGKRVAGMTAAAGENCLKVSIGKGVYRLYFSGEGSEIVRKIVAF